MLVATLTLLSGVQADAADVEALTEDWPPYNFMREHVVAGIATDLLRDMCTEARLNCSIELVPWARAYARVLTTPNTLLYTTARTPDREASFLWIGPFLPRQTWIFERNEHLLHLQTLSDLNHFHTGVVRGDAAVQDLERAGVEPARLEKVATEEINLRKLMAGHLDAITGTEVGVGWTLRVQGLDTNAVRRTLPLSQAGGYYFALNPGTAPETVQRLRDAFARLQGQHRIEALIKAYLQ